MIKGMSLSHALLGLLSVRPASGYDLMKAFDTSLANTWPATQSQVYTELSRLADNGMVDVSAAQGPHGRKEYALTDAGLAELQRWMTDPRPEPPRRSESLLRVFFLDVLSPEQRHEYMLRQAEQAAERHVRYQAMYDAIEWHGRDTINTNGRLALEYGLRLTTMYEEWARWAAEEVATRSASDADSDTGHDAGSDSPDVQGADSGERIEAARRSS
jgi:PadR family transcriptional regulator, regulatory protein AphA